MSKLQKPIHHALLTAVEKGWIMFPEDVEALANFIDEFIAPNVDNIAEIARLQGHIDYLQQAIQYNVDEAAKNSKEAFDSGATPSH